MCILLFYYILGFFQKFIDNFTEYYSKTIQNDLMYLNKRVLIYHTFFLITQKLGNCTGDLF